MANFNFYEKFDYRKFVFIADNETDLDTIVTVTPSLITINDGFDFIRATSTINGTGNFQAMQMICWVLSAPSS